MPKDGTVPAWVAQDLPHTECRLKGLPLSFHLHWTERFLSIGSAGVDMRCAHAAVPMLANDCCTLSLYERGKRTLPVMARNLNVSELV